MSPKLLIVLTVLAVVLGGLALVVKGTSSRASEPVELGPLFPGLADRLNDATSVEVTTGEGTYTVRLEGGRWVLADKGGYPVKVEDVRGALWALSELERIQPMTDDPARYGRLGVQDRGTPSDAASEPGKHIVLRNAAGKEIAALIVGQPRGSGRGLESFYARIPSEQRSWLVEGKLPLPENADAWLDRQPVKLERKAVRAVETRHPNGDVVRISRPSAEQQTFGVEGIPEGRELRFATAASGMATALEYLSFEDVAPAATFESGEDAPVETTLWSFDGLRIDARIWSKTEDEHWVAFAASYDAPAPAAVADDVAGPALPTPAEPDPAQAAAVEKRAADLNERLVGWVYRVAPYNKGNLAKRMEDLTQPIAPPDEEEVMPEWDVELGGETDAAGSHEGHDHGDAPTTDEPAPDEPPADPAPTEPPPSDEPRDDSQR